MEETLKSLQEQINEIKLDIEYETKELNERIGRLSRKVDSEISEAKSALRKLASNVESVSVGGFKVQLFGVTLIVYGAISGYLA